MTSERDLPVRELLDRLERLVSGLERIGDPAGRETARQAMQVLLDLHGMALARIMGMVASDRSLLDRFAADEAIKPVLLLYGLHPENPATRIRRALEELRPRLSPAGIVVALGRVTGATAKLRISGALSGEADLRHEIEDAVTDAAPELEEISLEWLSEADVAEPADLAG